MCTSNCVRIYNTYKYIIYTIVFISSQKLSRGMNYNYSNSRIYNIVNYNIMADEIKLTYLQSTNNQIKSR